MESNQTNKNYSVLVLIEAGTNFLNSLSIYKGYYNEKFTSSFYNFQTAIKYQPAENNHHKELYKSFLVELVAVGSQIERKTSNKRFFNQFYSFCAKLLRLSNKSSSLVGLMQTPADDFDLLYIKDKKQFGCFYFRKKKSERASNKIVEDSSKVTNPDKDLSSE